MCCFVHLVFPNNTKKKKWLKIKNKQLQITFHSYYKMEARFRYREWNGIVKGVPG